LKETESKGFLFSPNTKQGERKAIDIVNEALPELKGHHAG